MSYFSVNLTPPVQPAIFPVHIAFFLYYCRVKLILYYKSAYTKSQKNKKEQKQFQAFIHPICRQYTVSKIT